MHTMPTTNLSSLPPQKKFIKCSLGPFPLNFNLVQGKIGFCSMKRNRAPKKIKKLFHLNPANIFCGHIFCHFLSKSVFLPVQSASMFFPQQYAAKNTETINNMYSFDVTSKSWFSQSETSWRVDFMKKKKNEHCSTYGKCISTCHCHIIFLHSNFSDWSFSFESIKQLFNPAKMHYFYIMSVPRVQRSSWLYL